MEEMQADQNAFHDKRARDQAPPIPRQTVMQTDTVWLISKFENLIFFIYFFNKDISYIPSTFLKFWIHVDEGHMEGRVSQILDIGPSFYFMQSRKKSFKK